MKGRVLIKKENQMNSVSSDNELKTINTTGVITQFEEVVTLIRQSREKIIYTANKTLVDLYWRIGAYISEKIEKSVWGDGVVKQLAEYIAYKTPDLKGFSAPNLWRMKQFYETYDAAGEKLSALLREISWSNNVIILSRTKTNEEREFYLRLCVKEGLSSRELNRQIDAALFERTMLSEPKLSTVLRELQPAAKQFFRDYYVMEFIGGKELEGEHSMKTALIKQMKQFILELGKDFIFVGEEYRLQVGSSDFRIDLLFYHRELQCLVAFELKTERFKPEHLGQLNFYLEALDRDVKKAKENPSIGILLCKDKDNEVVEYALSRSLSPTMVAEYELCLPDKKMLQQKLREIYERDSKK
jgi:predicted nuclease of restriction endonuclease-like (RecB) superfamily